MPDAVGLCAGQPLPALVAAVLQHVRASQCALRQSPSATGKNTSTWGRRKRVRTSFLRGRQREEMEGIPTVKTAFDLLVVAEGT